MECGRGSLVEGWGDGVCFQSQGLRDAVLRLSGVLGTSGERYLAISKKYPQAPGKRHIRGLYSVLESTYVFLQGVNEMGWETKSLLLFNQIFMPGP